jgi:hypothetical protein
MSARRPAFSRPAWHASNSRHCRQSFSRARGSVE